MKKNVVTSEFQKRKREKFIELAESRVKKAITNLRLIGNLSRKNNYDYTDEDVKKITAALEKELKNVKDLFKRGSEMSSEDTFKL
tara:strand:- start:9 stop:263 length:255 start_codon:yes stop_codon:yes gene_type:complete